MTQHSRQPSFASSFVSTSAYSNHTNTIVSKKRAPVKIGPWKLGKTLGKGATGRVFLATNVENNKKAAVKIVSKAALTTEQTNEHDDQGCDSAGLSYGIEREIIIMKLLNHKNVLRLYDVWETEKALYLVLEYVEGGELFDLLVDNGPLPEKTAVEFFRQIILGASYCHSLGICHRDLKPENILLDKDLNVKIADFGMAALESGRLLETSCGSPHYAAPEIVSGLHYHGAESDVWSCGVILFALLTGRLPFDDDNIRDLLLKVQVGKYEIVEDLSPEAIDLIHQMLTVDPEKRIKTRNILNHPLIKQYYDCESDAAFTELPSPECGSHPVNSKEDIDKRILENLVILWHGRTTESIIEALLSPIPNAEKTFYSLLLRYRHDHSDSNHKNNKDQLVRSSSVISKVTDPISNSSTPPSVSSTNSSNRKRLSIIASTPTKRPVSFQKVKNYKSRDSLDFKELSTTNITPPSSSTSNQNLVLRTSTNRSSLTSSRSHEFSKLLSSNNANSDKPLIPVDTTPTKRGSKIPSETSNLKNLIVKSNTKSKVKRNSVTSKVLSSYAKMAAYEKKTSSPEEYGKRTSSDFAALCDVLFGDESKMNTKISNSDSMATINAIVFGNRRSSTYLSSSPKKRNSKIQNMKSKRQSISKQTQPQNRNSSNPIERITKLLNSTDINDLERRTASDIHTGTFDLAEPPKPISRLDPRYRAYETYQKRSSQHAAYLLQLQHEAEQEARAEAEIKAQEEKLKQEQEELERLRNKKENHRGSDIVDKHFSGPFGPSTGTVLRKSESPNIFLPKPKVSQLKSNRYSTLSMYSTKASSKRLSFYLKELDDEIAKNTVDTKKDKLSRLSMLISEPDFMESENSADLNLLHNDKSMNTLNEDDAEDDDQKESDNHSIFQPNNVDSIGKPKSASVSNALDDGLCFITPSTKPTAPAPTSVSKIEIPATAAIPPPARLSSVGEKSSDVTNGSSVYDSVPIMDTSKGEDTFTSDAENKNQKGPKLPNIPGSPIKRNIQPANSHNTFEIFEDAVRKSKQEFDELESRITATSANETPAQKIEKTNDVEKAKPKPINIEKTRQPLGTKHTNLDSNTNIDKGSNANTPRKDSFFSKMAQIQPSTERKSSFGKTFKSLFSANSLASPESLQTVLSIEDAFEALKTLLDGWKHYGIGSLYIDSNRKVLKGEITKNNSLNVKVCKFTCTVSASNIGDSKMTFTHDKGSAKSFSRLVGEVRRILANEHILVR